MALTEKRKRELDAVLDLSPGSSQREPIQVGTDEDKLARLNAMAADRGEEPISLESLQAAQNVGKPLPEPPTKEKAAHLFGSWGGGLLDIADMPYHISQAKEAVGGWIDKKAPGVRDIYNMHPVEMGKDWLFEQMEPGVLTGDVPATSVVPGLKQAREYSEELKLTPEQLELAPGTAMAGKGMEWLGVPGISTGVGLTRSAIKGGTDALKQALPDAGKQLAREAKVAGSMSTGAGLGSGLGQATDREEWGMFGELVGGVTGLVAALKTGKAANLSAAQEKMLNKLMEKFESPQEAIAALEEAVDKGEVGTLMDLTGSQNIANVEAQLMSTEVGNEALTQTMNQRVDQIYDDTMDALNNDMPAGGDRQQSVNTARQTTDRKVAQIEAEGKTQLTQAREAADVAGDTERQIAGQERQAADQRLKLAREAEEEAARVRSDVDPGGRSDEYSGKVAGKYNAAETDHADTVSKPAWKAFDDGPKVDTIPMRTEVGAYLETLEKQALAQLLDEFPALKGEIGSWPAAVPPSTFTDTIQDFKSAINEASVAGKSNRHTKRLGEIVAIMEESLTQASPEYRKAVAATNEGYNRFGPAYIGDVRKADKEVPETLVSNLGVAGDRGAATIRLIKQAEIAGVEDDLANFVKSRAVASKNLQDFLIENRAMLDGLDPTVRNDIVRLAEAEYAKDSALTQATAQSKLAETTSRNADTAQTNLQKALEAEELKIGNQTESLVESTRKSVTAQYGKGDEAADFVVQDILTTRDGPEKLAKLRDDLLEADAAQGGVGNMDSFNARVNAQVEDQLFDVLENSAGKSREAYGDAIKKFRAMRRRLVQNELLSADDADRIDEVLAQLQTNVIRKKAVARVGDIVSAGDETTNLLSAFGATALLGRLPGAYNLQLGGAARRYFQKGLEAEPTKRNIEALSKYLSDPKAFLAGIEKLDSNAAKEQFFLSKLLGNAQAAEILGGE